MTTALPQLTVPARWMPVGIPPGCVPFTFSPTAGERKIYKRRRWVRPSVWAERHRVLTTETRPGPWRNRTMPHAAGILDASFTPSVEVVIICAPPQTAKSEIVNTCLAYAADVAPGSALVIYPDELTARENSKFRIQPMFSSSPRLRQYLTGTDDDVSYLLINLLHMQIYMGWARSVARLANKAVPYVVFDECDKYEAASKKEADWMSLGEWRTSTFRGRRKIWKLSTPTIETGPIWVALTTEAEVVYRYFLRCPFCGHFQEMDFARIRWPEDERSAERVETDDLAHYECVSCATHWKDPERDIAAITGEWRGPDGMELMQHLERHRPRKIGFHHPRWIVPFSPISSSAAAFLRGLKDKNKLKDFCNGHKAEPWVVYERQRDEDRILALRDARPRGAVPGGDVVSALTAGVDTQDDGWWYEIGAWGYGLSRESWQVREGFVTTIEDLARILWEDEYRDAAGNRYSVLYAAIDAMGHRTAEVYDFCRKNRGRITPVKGMGRKNQPITWSNQEFYPASKRPIPGGMMLALVDVGHYKDLLSTLLTVGPGDPGAWHLHAETTEEWARQMVAEVVDEKGEWVCPPSRPNHAWDVSVYRLVAAEIKGVCHMRQPEHRAADTKDAPRPAPSGWVTGGRAYSVRG